MRLYHALLVTARHCYRPAGQQLPAGSYGTSSKSAAVSQDSTANSDVGASQGSAPSKYPVQQDSNVASGSGAPFSDDDTQQGVVVPATPSDSGSSPSATTGVGASQETMNSGSGVSPAKQGLATPAPTPGLDVAASQDTAPSSFNEGIPPSTPGKQGLTTPAPTTPSTDEAPQKTDVAASSDVAGEADPSVDVTEAPTATTQAPTVASSSSSAIAAGNSTTPAPASPLKDNSKLCAKPRVVVTGVDVGATVENDEDEAALKVIAIAALPSGGSRIAFQSGDNVIVRELDANDKLVSSSLAVKVPLHDFGDIYADKDGFVIVGTRDAEGGGTLNCGNRATCVARLPTRLCLATACTCASLPPYSTSATDPDVYMIWWYAHHGRIAFDGTNWAAYFGAAQITLRRNLRANLRSPTPRFALGL
ncbi:hypothetical protein PHYSODRAFT_249206 [Phytophthora sojae]|uniref:Uncharacterized protein n=1 Tax=Phytophthora sojae (strain P6497) TaxID=1094619 RepID=G4YSJ5_PHYSP|nr:hypothetical protein PHYSODRAFT_249206 [Phytophthora sojae]EGZ23011.1 hypothetical protein PHYSODRAFT_249206 [Phytophthora sojae]|eukprot:XP_009518299.1 hypothetical protein PHYSODRAFT_249206 [Phytophthora sojae]